MHPPTHSIDFSRQEKRLPKQNGILTSPAADHNTLVCRFNPDGKLTSANDDYCHKLISNMCNAFVLNEIICDQFGNPCDSRILEDCYLTREKT